MPEAAARHSISVSRKETLLDSIAHECTDWRSGTSRRVESLPTEGSLRGEATEDGRTPLCSGAKRRLLSGGGISALRLVWLVRSVHTCAIG